MGSQKSLPQREKYLISSQSSLGRFQALRDQLRAVNGPNEVSKAIGGWSEGNDVSSSYGLGYELEMKREWLTKAYAWLG